MNRLISLMLVAPMALSAACTGEVSKQSEGSGGALTIGGTTATGGIKAVDTQSNAQSSGGTKAIGTPSNGGMGGDAATAGGTDSCTYGTLGCACDVGGICTAGLTCRTTSQSNGIMVCTIPDTGTGGSSGMTGATGGRSNTGGVATGGSIVGNGGVGTGGSVAGTGGKTIGGTTGTGGSGGLNTQTYCNGIFQGMSCSPTVLQADLRAVDLLLVLDESGSMNDPPIAGAASKWTIVKQALNSALTPVSNSINFGLLLFPYLEGGIPVGSTSPADNCAVPANASLAVNVPITAGATGVQNVLSAVNSQSPAGGTPTAQALRRAYEYYTTGDGKDPSGSKWVMLVTDGGANCNAGLTCTASTCTQNMDNRCGAGGTNINCCDGGYGYICLDDVATTSQIQLLAAAGIKTFVVGLPGSEAYAASLNNFASAGKVPNPDGTNGQLYYAVSASSAQQDLTNLLGKITTQLTKTCDIPLAASLTDTVNVNVTIDCVLQPAVKVGPAADAGVDGYYIDGTKSPAHLELVGAPCTSILTNVAQRVDVVVGCPSIQ